MQSERELLEKAAKAAGIEVRPGNGFQKDRLFRDTPCNDGIVRGMEWNPLTNDGDALRLAVKLRLSIDHNHPADNDEWVIVSLCDGMGIGPTEKVDGEGSRAAATRLAITRAAASIADQGE